MNQTVRALILTAIAGAAASATPLPAGDVLSIALEPTDGALHGAPGSAVGWGFVINWSSSNQHWISFTGTAIGSPGVNGSETNPSVLNSYTDFLGATGGPTDFADAPTHGTWSQQFNNSMWTGVGAYEITSDPEQVGAVDSGQLSFFFDLFDGDPLESGTAYLGSYDYYSPETAFAVSVDAAAVPEPTTWALIAAGALLCFRKRTSRRAGTGPSGSLKQQFTSPILSPHRKARIR